MLEIQFEVQASFNSEIEQLSMEVWNPSFLSSIGLVLPATKKIKLLYR